MLSLILLAVIFIITSWMYIPKTVYSDIFKKTIQTNTDPAAKTDDGTGTDLKSKLLTLVFCGISILGSFAVSVILNWILHETLKHFYMSFPWQAFLQFAIILICFIGCSFAVKYITEETNKNFAVAVIVFTVLYLITGSIIGLDRGDNFNPETGESETWITSSTHKLWRDKPDNIKFDPTTGEELRKATKEDFHGGTGFFRNWFSSTPPTPKPKPLVVFEKTYTWADAISEEGSFYSFEFGKEDVKIGDIIEITAQPLDGSDFSGNEIYLWKGEEFTSKWEESVNGRFLKKVENLPIGKKLGLSFYNRKDLKVVVRVARVMKNT